ncbi:MAG: DUF86 domain-containing protein [Patescibacteria group bacterium]
MSKSVKVLLEHVLQSADLVADYIKDATKKKLLEDVGLQDKVIRRLAIIGEAVKHLPSDFRNKHKAIPWKEIAGMRDILVHEYYNVDAPLVWRVAKFRLPSMRKYLSRVIENNK